MLTFHTRIILIENNSLLGSENNILGFEDVSAPERNNWTQYNLKCKVVSCANNW
jgi:hypothetical protein